jgi:CATRA-Associated Small Protein
MGVPGDAESISDLEFEAELIADAMDVVREVESWRLAEVRWERVREILGSLAAALAARDLPALRDATTDLELIGPVRLTRIGATPVVAPPPKVRERVNHLVYTLTEADRRTHARRPPEQGDQHGGDQHRGDRRGGGDDRSPAR